MKGAWPPVDSLNLVAMHAHILHNSNGERFCVSDTFFCVVKGLVRAPGETRAKGALGRLRTPGRWPT